MVAGSPHLNQQNDTFMLLCKPGINLKQTLSTLGGDMSEPVENMLKEHLQKLGRSHSEISDRELAIASLEIIHALIQKVSLIEGKVEKLYFARQLNDGDKPK